MEQVWLLNTCYDAPGEQSVAIRYGVTNCNKENRNIARRPPLEISFLSLSLRALHPLRDPIGKHRGNQKIIYTIYSR